MDIRSEGQGGKTTNDLFAFLTTAPNAEVGRIYPKAMPVTLTEPQEIERWLMAPANEALRLQRSLPDDALKIVAIRVPEDQRPQGLFFRNRIMWTG